MESQLGNGGDFQSGLGGLSLSGGAVQQEAGRHSVVSSFASDSINIWAALFKPNVLLNSGPICVLVGGGESVGDIPQIHAQSHLSRVLRIGRTLVISTP